ncbi:SMI1/KNR4 family protein [Colwellia sp. D2M02]|uniref:SMI1/KNR4 family protein n=1 Tax=Colwellia sp. D2M02 TaxID=2841562 RepID=UPI001C08F1F9|nr:SMI1/KNR4 family protein [Colwellia sp. D2M02]MBU2892525.1 SMI1/KNR4 family protein [Colwellia sp. D2M02]
MKDIDLFIENWAGKSAMVPISHQDIIELEAQLQVALPQAYKYLLTTYGLVRTPNVLTKTCDLNVEVANVQDFLSVEDVLSLSKLYEMTGMPTGHIVFASDSEGNMFCFKKSECDLQLNDVPVWFYNQALCTVTQVAQGFVPWLIRFNTAHL